MSVQPQQKTSSPLSPSDFKHELQKLKAALMTWVKKDDTALKAEGKVLGAQLTNLHSRRPIPDPADGSGGDFGDALLFLALILAQRKKDPTSVRRDVPRFLNVMDALPLPQLRALTLRQSSLDDVLNAQAGGSGVRMPEQSAGNGQRLPPQAGPSLPSALPQVLQGTGSPPANATATNSKTTSPPPQAPSDNVNAPTGRVARMSSLPILPTTPRKSPKKVKIGPASRVPDSRLPPHEVAGHVIIEGGEPMMVDDDGTRRPLVGWQPTPAFQDLVRSSGPPLIPPPPPSILPRADSAELPGRRQAPAAPHIESLPNMNQKDRKRKGTRRYVVISDDEEADELVASGAEDHPVKPEPEDEGTHSILRRSKRATKGKKKAISPSDVDDTADDDPNYVDDEDGGNEAPVKAEEEGREPQGRSRRSQSLLEDWRYQPTTAYDPVCSRCLEKNLKCLECAGPRVHSCSHCHRNRAKCTNVPISRRRYYARKAAERKQKKSSTQILTQAKSTPMLSTNPQVSGASAAPIPPTRPPAMTDLESRLAALEREVARLQREREQAERDRQFSDEQLERLKREWASLIGTLDNFALQTRLAVTEAGALGRLGIQLNTTSPAGNWYLGAPPPRDARPLTDAHIERARVTSSSQSDSAHVSATPGPSRVQGQENVFLPSRNPNSTFPPPDLQASSPLVGNAPPAAPTPYQSAGNAQIRPNVDETPAVETTLAPVVGNVQQGLQLPSPEHGNHGELVQAVPPVLVSPLPPALESIPGTSDYPASTSGNDAGPVTACPPVVGSPQAENQLLRPSTRTSIPSPPPPSARELTGGDQLSVRNITPLIHNSPTPDAPNSAIPNSAPSIAPTSSPSLGQGDLVDKESPSQVTQGTAISPIEHEPVISSVPIEDASLPVCRQDDKMELDGPDAASVAVPKAHMADEPSDVDQLSSSTSIVTEPTRVPDSGNILSPIPEEQGPRMETENNPTTSSALQSNGPLPAVSSSLPSRESSVLPSTTSSRPINRSSSNIGKDVPSSDKLTTAPNKRKAEGPSYPPSRSSKRLRSKSISKDKEKA